MKPIMNRAARFAVSVGAVITGIILALALVGVVSSAPGHDEIWNRQQMIENQLRYISCLLLVPPEERIPEIVAACQVAPDD